MPETPEVTYLRNYIHKHCYGNILKDVNILKGRYINHGPPANFTEFRKCLPLKLTDVTKKGKVIFLYFGEWCLISKLGMTGWWFVPGDEPDWHASTENIKLHFANTDLIFSDFRNFGTLTITKNKEQIQKELNAIAPDILDKNTTFSMIKDRISNLKKDSLLEEVIVDQKLIFSGIGNYLKAEVLYAAKISPLRKINTLTIDDWKKIFTVGKKIAKYMLKMTSMSSDKYINSMKIYRRSKDPLGNIVKTHTTKTGRTTYWCPAIQI